MKALLEKLLHDKKVLILGFGREGQSTYKILRRYFPEKSISIADADETLLLRYPELHNTHLEVQTGSNYLADIANYDIIIKSPGISLSNAEIQINPNKITSQTDLFLQAFSAQVTGITGTKGKSTTASLIYHIYQQQDINTVLLGNIGLPFFEAVDQINPETRIVCELSSHQLEYLTIAPHISILTNIFEEHLDHYSSYEAYQWAKFQIALKQRSGDYFLYNPEDEKTSFLLKQNSIPGIKIPVNLNDFTGNGAGVLNNTLILRTEAHFQKIITSTPSTRLKGDHNFKNVYFAAVAAYLSGISKENILAGISDFQPLEHRLELCQTNGLAYFYNDSISTIPQATLAALNTLKNVHTLIAGGFDRGIDYQILTQAIANYPLSYLLLSGPAGKRIFELLKTEKKGMSKIQYFSRFDEAVKFAIQNTPAGEICLLSPAASSYDEFTNFEERGKRFKYLVKQE